jgi:hypothetical protein
MIRSANVVFLMGIIDDVSVKLPDCVSNFVILGVVIIGRASGYTFGSLLMQVTLFDREPLALACAELTIVKNGLRLHNVNPKSPKPQNPKP